MHDRAREAYEERSRQELQGKIVTSETRVFRGDVFPGEGFALDDRGCGFRKV